MNPEDSRSREELIAAIAKGAEPKFVFFWGHTPKVPGQIDQSWLSNWYAAPFRVGGITYATAEHYMMAEKARLFGDEAVRMEIVSSPDPGKAKALGRKVAGFDESAWREHRFGIVVRGNLEKFREHEELGDLLLRTGTKVLVEASPRDNIWGIGMGGNHENAANPSRWRGGNLLGFALMEVRQRLARV